MTKRELIELLESLDCEDDTEVYHLSGWSVEEADIFVDINGNITIGDL